MELKKRLVHVLIAFDQLVWVLLTLGAGYPDETISSAVYRLEKKGDKLGVFLRPRIDRLFYWEENHCRKAFLAESMRRHKKFDDVL